MLTLMKYKNISKKALSLVGVGMVKPGQEVEVEEPINNVNFQLVKKGERIEDENSARSENNNLENREI